MLIYLLGMGAATNALPAACWNYWTSGYVWATLLWLFVRRHFLRYSGMNTPTAGLISGMSETPI